MISKNNIVIFLILVCSTLSFRAQNITPNQKVLYKEINGDSLFLHVFKPKVNKNPTAAIVFFFGGGWVGGSPKQFYQQSEYFSSRGMVAICAEYRIKNIHRSSPFDAVEDGKSAIRWVREHSKELHIDPDKIVASGGSAGGHIAICTSLIEGLENETENLLISSLPNAIVAYNPVLDTTLKGYGTGKVKGREIEISPCHQIKKNMPPVLVFHGEKDTTVPFENADRFTSLMKKSNNKCELVAVENVGHGFFNGDFFRKGSGNKYYNITTYKTDIFLKKLGYLKRKPSLPENLLHVSCVGDSNTEAKYPMYLQEKLGKNFQVKNFGKGGATLLKKTNHPYLKTVKYKKSLKFSPDIVLIMFGTNDANTKWCLDEARNTEFKGTVQKEFKRQYVELINIYKNKNKNAEIYVLTPLPIFEHSKNRDPKTKERIFQSEDWVIPTIKEISIEQNVTFIDLHKLMKNSFKHTIDGVHLNEKGYKILAKKISKKIR